MPRSLFSELLENPEGLVEQAEALEAPVPFDSEVPVSPDLGTGDAIKWYNARRIASHMIWDVYAAAAIAHYRSSGNTAPPLMKEKGFVSDALPAHLADVLEETYFKCEVTPWKDARPRGYSNNPFVDEALIQQYHDMTIHRMMSPEIGQILTEIFVLLAPVIERSLGYFWAVGAVRLYEATSISGDYHSDGFPLSIKKIMIYPSGADPQKGSTEIILPNGGHHIVTGGKGVWCLFDNTLRQHRALGSKISTPRPTIEVCVTPAFKNNPVVCNHGIVVGYPWLPPDMEELTASSCPEGFTYSEIKQRLLQQMAWLADHLPNHR